MLADQHGHALMPVLVQQRQQLAMPEGEYHGLAAGAKRLELRVGEHANSPRPAPLAPPDAEPETPPPPPRPRQEPHPNPGNPREAPLLLRVGHAALPLC